MDGNTTLIIIVVIFAIVILAWALLFRKKGKASIEVGGVEISVGDDNPSLEQVNDSAPAHNTSVPESGGDELKKLLAQHEQALSFFRQVGDQPGIVFYLHR